MRKLLPLLALASIFAACQNEQQGESAEVTPIECTLHVTAEDITRAESATGYSSALGAIQNFDDQDWAKYDLRYTFEVYTAEESNICTPIENTRQVKTIDRFNEDKDVYFNVSLTPHKSYRFVVFADFVNEDESNDLYYNTSNLRNITTLKGKISPMDEARDAYFASEVMEVTSHMEKSIDLTRPFGKLRAITTDYEYISSYAVPAKAKVTYYDCEIFKSLNAVSGSISTARAIDELSFEYPLAKDGTYTAGVDKKSSHMTLFTDYLLAPRVGQDEVHFTLSVWDTDGDIIKTQDFNVPIPVERNNLTTISGNLLTAEADINVNIHHKLQEGKIVEQE